MRYFKLLFICCFSMFIAACGTTLSDKLMNGGTITLQDFVDSYETVKTNRAMDADREIVKKGLKFRSDINTDNLKSSFRAIFNEENKLNKDKYYQQCLVDMRNANRDRYALNSFKNQNSSELKEMYQYQAVNMFMTAMTGLTCSQDVDCAMYVAEQKNGMKKAKNTLKQMYNSTDQKINQKFNEKGMVAQLQRLTRKADASAKRAHACATRIKPRTEVLQSLLSQSINDCMSNNWFGLNLENNIKTMCYRFFDEGKYKKYL